MQKAALEVKNRNEALLTTLEQNNCCQLYCTTTIKIESDPMTSNTNRQTQRDAMANQPEDKGICYGFITFPINQGCRQSFVVSDSTLLLTAFAIS